MRMCRFAVVGLRDQRFESRVQRAAARKVRQQVFHLVRQDAAALQIDVFRIGRRERHGDQLHARLLGRSPRLRVVAAAASRDDVHPRIAAALA